MTRHYKRKPGATAYTVTPEETLATAHESLKKTQRDVCKDFNLTRSVLQRYLKKMDVGDDHRGQTVLSLEMEKSIVRHLTHVSE